MRVLPLYGEGGYFQALVAVPLHYFFTPLRKLSKRI